ncbi:MAG: hypothetical protein HQK98_06360 [Nitrospirae bacterium]|nr:hypothetical protein [Nitrospirota bacterium]
MVDHANNDEGPSFVIANLPRGRNMWDRDFEVEKIWKTLENDNVLLTACRRFGKTSIMNKMKENPQDDFVCFMFNVQSMKSPHDFVAALYEEICDDGKFVSFIKKAKKITKEFLGRLEKLKISMLGIDLRESKSSDWQDMANKFVNVLSAYDGKLLFLTDELLEFILNISKHHSENEACDFLNWFREIRQSDKLSNIRWLIGGSIGIEHALKKVGAKVHMINDLSIIVLKPFSDKIGREYVEALLKKEGNFSTIPSGIVEKILTTIGSPVPYFLQILIKESLNAMNESGESTLTDEIIEEAYHNNVLGPASKTYFQHYYDRLSEYYDRDEEKIAKHILRETARTGRYSGSQ